MAENSKIEWTDHTFNPWIGCTNVSPACDNCYAEAWDRESRHENRDQNAAINRDIRGLGATKWDGILKRRCVLGNQLGSGKNDC